MAEAVAAGAPLEAVRGGVFAGWEEGNFESAVRHSASRWARLYFCAAAVYSSAQQAIIDK